MDKKTKQNWEKVRVALEAAGKTDSFFYRRAVAIGLRPGRAASTK
jgi:hypothetical protein